MAAIHTGHFIVGDARSILPLFVGREFGSIDCIVFSISLHANAVAGCLVPVRLLHGLFCRNICDSRPVISGFCAALWNFRDF